MKTSMTFYQRHFFHLQKRLELIYEALKIGKGDWAGQTLFQRVKLQHLQADFSRSSQTDESKLTDPYCTFKFGQSTQLSSEW